MPSTTSKKKVKNKKKSKRSSKQKRKYSGKKKQHTHKIQVVQNATTKGIICLDFSKGGDHDFKLFKESKLHIHNECFADVDSGYQGIANLHKNVNIPKKKARRPNQTKEEKKKAKKLSKAEKKQAKLLLLSKEDRLNNTKLATQRVGIEHINRQMKIFKIIQQTYRSHQRFGMRATLIAAFINANLFFF
jgi:Transposase DDE domain